MDSGISADDRRAALGELKDLLACNPQAQLAVGHIGLHVLTAVLQEDGDDVELMRGALEALIQAVTSHADCPARGGVEPAAINAELFGRDGRSLKLVFGLLDDQDFYVRYHALQLMCKLLAHSQHHVQAVVLSSPVGVLRLLDMVSERDVIRNEALLLLNNLCHGREEVQKVLAFEGALERLFVIVKEEGGAQGGVVVQDCLQLVNNLLRSCAPNQKLFRESGLVQSLPALLTLHVGESSALSRQEAANVLCALELVLLLLTPDDDGRVANQAALFKAGVLDALLPLALGSRARFPAVRIAARACVAALVAEFLEAQEALGVAFVAGDGEERPPSPALLVALQAVLQGHDEGERRAAEHLVAAYCGSNAVGQRLLLSTLAPVGDEDPTAPASFGSMLASALLVEGNSEVACRAASLLQHLLFGNNAAKEQLLRVPLEARASGGTLPELFMPRCTRMLAEAARGTGAHHVDLQIALLRLTFVWLEDCAAAVASFVASPAHLPLLIDLSTRADAHVAGLSAAVLGCCVLDNESAGACDAHTVLDAIVSRLTLAEYFRNWEAMRDSDAFRAASTRKACAKPLVTRASAAAAVDGVTAFTGGKTAGMPETSVYTHALALALERMEHTVRDRLLSMFARPKQVAARNAAVWEVGEGETVQGHTERLKALLQAADAELAELRARNAMLVQQLMAGQPAPSPSDAHAASTAAAGVDVQAQEVLARVREDAEREIAAARAEAAEARNAAARNEESLTALSEAYNTLEAAHFRFEEELRRASSSGGITAEQLRKVVAEARQEGMVDGAAQAAAEHEQELNDLLVCLGQEEAKVMRLREALERAGVADVDAIIASPLPDGDET